MKFTKNKGMSLVAVLIVLAVYNVIAFVLPFERHGGFWAGYGFSLLAILITAAVGFYALGHDGVKSKFYGLPLISVAWTYLAIQLIVGLLEMVIPDIPFQYGLVINVILLGACLVGLIGIDMAKEEVERLDEKVKEKVFLIKSLQADIEDLIGRANNDSLKKAVKELAETIRFSDPMSSPQLAAIENKIEIKTAALAESISEIETAKALCDELQQLFAERNRKCKISK